MTELNGNNQCEIYQTENSPLLRICNIEKSGHLAVTETGIKHDKALSTIADISPPGCSFFREPRANQRAGRGVGILVSDQLKTDIHPLPSFETFEAISARIGNNSFSGFVVCLYRLQNGTCQFLMNFKIH